MLLLLRSTTPTPRYRISQIPDVLLGTGKKILVWDATSQSIKERATSEGIPLVMVGGVIREILATETLQS